MSNINDNRIIAPPIEEEVYPYRRVWRSIIIQTSLLTIFSVLAILFQSLFNITVFTSNSLPILSIVALFPVGLWLLFSVFAEQSVVAPRPYLMRVAVISGLGAIAIGLPLTHEFFRILDWLPYQSAIQRIIGFTVTVGIIDTGLKFLIIRFLVFPDQFRIRTDPVAYCVASAIGYSTAITIDAIFSIQPILIVGIIYVLTNYVIQISSGLIISYGLSQAVFSHSALVVLPFTLLLSSTAVGLVMALRSLLMAGALSIDGSFARPIFSIVFLIVFLLVTLSIILFLYTVAERRSREIYNS